jgi:hypothetical protein
VNEAQPSSLPSGISGPDEAIIKKTQQKAYLKELQEEMNLK